MKSRRITFSILFAGLLLAVLLAGCGKQTGEYQFTENGDKGDMVLYVFWGDGCSHCEEARPMLGRLDAEYRDLNIRSFEVWYSPANQALFEKMGEKFGITSGLGTPTFFLGDTYWVGYSETIDESISATVKELSSTSVVDAGSGIMP